MNQFLSSLLIAAMAAAPAPGSQSLAPRDDSVLCTNSDVVNLTPGALYCFTFDDPPRDLSYDECLGQNGYELARSSNVQCNYIQNEEGAYTQTTCPGDPASAKQPDGTDTPPDIVNTLVNFYCNTATPPGVFDFANIGFCFGWAYSHNSQTEIDGLNSGAQSLCEAFTGGFCTCIDTGACTTGGGGGGSSG